MNFRKTIFRLTIFTLTSCSLKAQPHTSDVRIVGQMKNVMWKGELHGNIYLDTIANKTNLYGFGPLEYLSGEILVIDGKSYKSMIVSDTAMKVEETYDIKAPFFGYANITKWRQEKVPDSIQTNHQLEQFLDKATKHSPRPFLFKVSGIVKRATIHIVNLPRGARVSSPDEAHNGQKNYTITNEQTEIIGFFSTNHQAIFTHHDSYLHMHLITADRKKMGHLDEVLFEKGTMQLYLPIE